MDPRAEVPELPDVPRVPVESYTPEYFRRWNYADRGTGRFSMYRFARDYYAALVRRYGRGGGRLLELGCGLGHLLGRLQDDFDCVGIDRMQYSVEQTRANAPRAEVRLMDADDLSAFADDEFAVVVALHLVEHLPDPAHTIREVGRILEPGGVWLFATPHPEYGLRRFKDRERDAIGKDETHINVHPPVTWRRWCEDGGLGMVRHFGDGLWDVPYLPVVPRPVQFAVFGLPALAQVLTRTTRTPLSWGVNQIGIARNVGPG